MTDLETRPRGPNTRAGLVYRLVTRHWPRIAAGLMASAAVLEWIVGGLTSNGALEFYVFAWATATGGLWFMSEKAERALSQDTRRRVVTWVKKADFHGTPESLPSQFVFLFDRVFSEKHWSLRCFLRSCLASVAALAVSYALLRPTFQRFTDLGEAGPATELAGGIVFSAFLLNVIPDYLSLLETRWLLGVAHRRAWRFRRILTLDVLITLAIFFVSTLSILLILGFILFKGTGFDDRGDAYWAGRFVGAIMAGPVLPAAVLASTFFTSVWLWLYAASVPISKTLTRIGGGVGFLLQVTDVEHRPFRSIGFVGVVILSLLFLAGLPFVVLV